MTENKALLSWINEMAELTTPDKIVWVTEGEKQIEALKEEAVATGLMERLNEEKLPGAFSTAQNLTMSQGLKTAPLSAPQKKRWQAPQITGSKRTKCTPASAPLQKAV